MANDCLFELGVAELPPKLLLPMSRGLSEGVRAGLSDAKLGFSEVKALVTPRRLSFIITELEAAQPTTTQQRRGPAVKAAYDEAGKPTPAAEGFARSCGVAFDKLEKLETDKGAWLAYTCEVPGKPLADILPGIIQTALDKLPLPKTMRWGGGKHAFIRPVLWAALIHGSEVVPGTFYGVETSNVTYGHRFHAPEAVPLTHPKEYEAKLEKAYVIADFDKRQAQITSQITTLVETVKGQAVIVPELLEEVTGLVEWPHALLANFDKDFLKVPPEVLICAMHTHQKCFHLVDDSEQLLPHFITVSNIESKQPETVTHGNERVMHARLSDAAFFYETDCKTPLAQRVNKLEAVTFQKELGSLLAKTHRVTALAEHIAREMDVDSALITRASSLAKTDLLTDMVGEFPELQGVMGAYYAKHDGEPAVVAEAIREHYHPRFSKDTVPASQVGAILAISDRIDTLVGIFGAVGGPKRDKDPFGLRRAALGVLRILIEKALPLDVITLLEFSEAQYQRELSFKNTNIVDDISTFMLERLRAWYQEKTIPADVFNAVAEVKPRAPHDFHRRIEAVVAFQALPEASHLAAANKRVSNILTKQVKGNSIHAVEPSLLKESAEKQLADAMAQQIATITPLFQAQDYTGVLTALASLQQPIDTFFDDVMVMVEDDVLRMNRIALLSQLRALFLQVADISQLQSP